MRSDRRSFIRNEYFIQSLILLALVVALFPGAVIRGDVCVPGSLLFQRYPYDIHREKYGVDEFARNQITSEMLAVFNNYNLLATRAFEMGEWPLWNDLQLTGTPLLANYQSTVLYPPRLVFRFFEHYTATTFFYMLKLWLCGATAYLFARGFGLGIFTSRLVSIGWMLSMFNMSWWYLPITDVSAWIPLLTLGVEWILQGRYRRGVFAGAIGATLLLLGGHPESSFAFGLGVGAYFFLRVALMRMRGKRLLKTLGACVVLWGLAIGVCMSQLLPFAEYLVHSETFSQRAKGEERRPFIKDSAAIALWVPRFFGFTADQNYWDERDRFDNTNFVSLVYAGMGVWVGISTLFARGNLSTEEKHRRVALIVPSVIMFLLAYGAPVALPILQLPVFSSMWPMHHVSFAMFALPVLAAMGLENWTRHTRKPEELRIPLLVLGGIALAIIVLFVAFYPEMSRREVTRYVLEQVLLAALFGALSFWLLLWHVVGRRKTLVLQLFWVVLAVDLLVAARGMRPSESRLYLYPDTPLTTYLQQQAPPYRVSMSTGPRLVASMRLGMLVPYGVEEAWGYDGIYPERVTRFYEEIKTLHWHKLEPILAINEYIPPPEAGPVDTVQLEFIGILDRIGIWRNRNALPRVRLVGTVLTAPDADALFALMKSPEFNPVRMAATEMPPSEPLPSTRSTDLGEARLRKRTTLTATVSVDAKERCALIFADQWFPGWKAYIDGQPAELWPAYYCMRGVIVPPGKHEVVFRYQPLSFTIGISISTAVLVGSSVFSVGILMRRRRLVALTHHLESTQSAATAEGCGDVDAQGYNPDLRDCGAPDAEEAKQ